MTERVQQLLHFILAKRHHAQRQDVDFALAEQYAANSVPPILRMSGRFARMAELEQPRLLPGERIAFVRTIRNPPEIFTPSEWECWKQDAYIHERGFISNLCPDYASVIGSGLTAQRDRVSVHLQSGNPEQREFAMALVQYIDAVLELTDRYRAEAERVGDAELAAVLKRVPRQGARTFREALQFFRILHFSLWLDGEYHNTVGRFDQYMLPYLQADLQAGRLDRAAALELLEDFFLSFNKDSDLYPGVQQGDNGQSMVLGGMRPDGSDGFNLLSELCLEACGELKLIDPKINLRVGRDTPLSVYEQGTELTKAGLGFPQYSNDDVVIPALMRLGYEEADARDYVVAACWEFIIPGKGMEIVNIDALCFPKAVDTAVHRYLASDGTFDAFLAHTCACVREEGERIADRLAGATVRFVPSAWISMLMQGCVARGTDITRGGKYNNFGVHGAGLATAADSLAAIRRFVYEQRFCTPQQMIDAVDRDFAGQDELLHRVRSEAPKMGQDDDQVDGCAVRLLDAFAEALAGKRNRMGGCFRAGAGSAMYYLWHVEQLGASPDGRRKGEPLGANFSPSLFAKTGGPFSVIRSFTKPHCGNACNGGPLTLEFHGTLFSDEECIQKVAQLVQTFIRLGGHQLQLNAVDAGTLRDAQRHPEQYPQLVVRVWGWSAYFVELDRPYQEHVLARQEYTV